MNWRQGVVRGEPGAQNGEIKRKSHTDFFNLQNCKQF